MYGRDPSFEGYSIMYCRSSDRELGSVRIHPRVIYNGSLQFRRQQSVCRCWEGLCRR